MKKESVEARKISIMSTDGQDKSRTLLHARQKKKAEKAWAIAEEGTSDSNSLIDFQQQISRDYDYSFW